ncbi:ATP-binding protein [Actinoplanes sp. TFC3]|uniref:ATP-binding protein n=1 Tax=Actinoplanes sp. TFC3 TaxID=1710355 RepID=UPI000837763F|nr:ATP-binding protein [Actinoplanes sp. TFC3]
MSSHPLLLYRDLHDLAERVAAGPPDEKHPVVLACDPAHHAALAGVLADRVIAPMRRPDIHTRPAAALAEYHRHARQLKRDATAVTIIAQPDPGTAPRAWIRAARCEAAVDLTADDSSMHLICAYPTSLPEPLLTSVLSTHAVLMTRDGAQPNQRHTNPAAVLIRHSPHRPVPAPAQPPVLHIAGSETIQDLHQILRQITAHLAQTPTLIRTDFVAAVNEILTNGYLHGAPPLQVTLWVGDQEVDCRVTDHGRGRPDPTAGYRARTSSRRAGAGLWLARQLCDDIDTWRHDGTFTVRAATSTAAPRNRQHNGAHARAETAHTRAALITARSRLWHP